MSSSTVNSLSTSMNQQTPANIHRNAPRAPPGSVFLLKHNLTIDATPLVRGTVANHKLVMHLTNTDGQLVAYEINGRQGFDFNDPREIVRANSGEPSYSDGISALVTSFPSTQHQTNLEFPLDIHRQAKYLDPSGTGYHSSPFGVWRWVHEQRGNF